MTCQGRAPICCAADDTVDRKKRRTLGLLVASGVATLADHGTARAAEPSKSPPQPGDELVFAEGPRKGQTITVGDLPDGGPMVAAWAKDPASGVVRSGSRLNRVLVVRLDPASLDEKTAPRAAEGGIVAYSGFCTHAGCPIQHWKDDTKVIHCHCHGSEFDPRANGRVVGGPARRSLAGLPLEIEDDRPIVAGKFVGKLGVATS